MQRHYKAIIVAVIIAFTLVFMQLDRTSITQDDTPSILETPSAALAPDVTFTLLDGRALKLRSLAGHTVLLHFWASWCVPCRQEFSNLLAHMAKAGDNIILLAVSGDANADNAKRFLASYTFDSNKVIIAHDPKHLLIEGTFQTFKYPETIIISPDFTLRRKVVGPMQEGDY